MINLFCLFDRLIFLANFYSFDTKKTASYKSDSFEGVKDFFYCYEYSILPILMTHRQSIQFRFQLFPFRQVIIHNGYKVGIMIPFQ